MPRTLTLQSSNTQKRPCGRIIRPLAWKMRRCEKTSLRRGERSTASVDKREIVEFESTVACDNGQALDEGHGQNQRGYGQRRIPASRFDCFSLAQFAALGQLVAEIHASTNYASFVRRASDK